MKQCRSLAAAGYQISLVVADGRGGEIKDGVSIIDVGAARGRLKRVTLAAWRIFRQALALDADIYHLHDPELLPIGYLLKRRGKKVIFDVHEDLPRQILGKPYIAPVLRKPISMCIEIVEKFVCRRLDAVFAATPHIRDIFEKNRIRSININNFPMLGELDAAVGWNQKNNEVCYVGGITAIRGISEVVQAFETVASGARLNLVGKFSEPVTEQATKRRAGWQHVNVLGFLDRIAVREVLKRSIAGLVTFKPAPNHIESQPNKMFEYMSAGLPVIASDFPLWREIIAGNDCGVLVDPRDPVAIAAAIDQLVGDPALAQRLGANGRSAVTERYNWSIEEQKLLQFYAETMGCDASDLNQADQLL
ncbi:glycosyltransferase family 4 protein [Devosia rhodophyticola]|uniref:Glycosyltransferase family 4 protein n=1 Tax=Devosia rhodophyticola TaxID=3026423 RepID=A0ABY7YZL4_9HYPH|nr:glycosyltransferase family 4 protein [Devosia rhodophyticola]WDR06697.1 glycosyltransferase family 4 protein [Devosia rhodophyticola]